MSITGSPANTAERQLATFRFGRMITQGVRTQGRDAAVSEPSIVILSAMYVTGEYTGVTACMLSWSITSPRMLPTWCVLSRVPTLHEYGNILCGDLGRKVILLEATWYLLQPTTVPRFPDQPTWPPEEEATEKLCQGCKEPLYYWNVARCQECDHYYCDKCVFQGTCYMCAGAYEAAVNPTLSFNDSASVQTIYWVKKEEGEAQIEGLGKPLGLTSPCHPIELNWHRCRVCGVPSPQIPYPGCWFCPERPSWHHGRCCPGRRPATHLEEGDVSRPPKNNSRKRCRRCGRRPGFRHFCDNCKNWFCPDCLAEHTCQPEPEP